MHVWPEVLAWVRLGTSVVKGTAEGVVTRTGPTGPGNTVSVTVDGRTVVGADVGWTSVRVGYPDVSCECREVCGTMVRLGVVEAAVVLDSSTAVAKLYSTVEAAGLSVDESLGKVASLAVRGRDRVKREESSFGVMYSLRAFNMLALANEGATVAECVLMTGVETCVEASDSSGKSGSAAESESCSSPAGGMAGGRVFVPAVTGTEVSVDVVAKYGTLCVDVHRTAS